ncbi:hypothetical protein FDH01_gp147 [Acinetobacter phage vB_AbaM_ME3]|uniref:Uncharacterized protein n=1 Tax=Acinetobacter phage vB_AbaM_ME3 TaxID=1837876 RepID=A0A172Q0W2_9CAUD|nr:hypothetical protein FDH01_gp147 [Acinetobacter phage vB_AbaM_ME3]AND75475.1 hypothetical protein ME3_314 [Acinetobacter phage vB_AbaM_ME3]
MFDLILFSVFFSPFIIAPVVDKQQNSNNIEILNIQYPIVQYKEKEYIPFEMLKYSINTVNCSTDVKTIHYEYTTKLSNNEVLNFHSVSKTFHVKKLDICLLKEFNSNG